MTDDTECEWPAQFGSWAERAPDGRSLSRSARSVPWRLRPPTVADARKVVTEAVRRSAPIFPVSRGRNWGYGSHLPNRDGAVILDLGGLDRIEDLDRDSLSVRIEPGVTQAALYEYLRQNAPDLAFNVTGSGRQTSVLGNALERGIGYSGEKDRDVYALEALLADGASLGPVAGNHHKSRPHAAGATIDGLFFQSNFAVVVGARLRLRLRQEAEDVVVLQGPFLPVMETLRAAYEQGLLANPSHVAEPGRSRRLGRGLLRLLWNREPTGEEVARCFPEQGAYNGLVPLYGRRRVVDATWKELRRTVRPGVRLRRVNERSLETSAWWLARLGARYQAARIRALRPILAFSWGEPSDAGLVSLDGFQGGDPDAAARGALYGNATSSANPSQAARVAEIVREHWKDSAFTWIPLDARCIITIYTLHFEDADASNVHAAQARIVAQLRQQGLPPYRLGIDTPAASGTEAIVKRLKSAFDPEGIIAPGRYESPCADA